MNYEKLENQGASGRKSIKFLPKSMKNAILKSADKELRHRNWTVDLKDPMPKQLAIDLFHKEVVVNKVRNPDTKKSRLGALTPTDHAQLAQEKKKTAMVLGSGTLLLMLLAYILFFKI